LRRAASEGSSSGGSSSGEGAPGGATGTTSDVTDSVQVEAEREARERAEELLEAETHFLNSMSHELRTPLTTITGFAEVLAEPDGASEQQKQEFARRIARSGERLQRTLQSVLDFAAIEGDADVDLSLEPTDVGRAVRRSADLHRPAADEKDLTFEVRGAANGESEARARLKRCPPPRPGQPALQRRQVHRRRRRHR
jgi:signal transduction histidine kinase